MEELGMKWLEVIEVGMDREIVVKLNYYGMKVG